MSTIATNGKQLLDVVKRMEPDEFDAFLDEAMACRRRPRAVTLSTAETALLHRINRGLPIALRERIARLTALRRKGSLTADAHQELLRLTHDAEAMDVDRAAALLKLAKLRQVSVRTLMKQMGIKAPAPHG